MYTCIMSIYKFAGRTLINKWIYVDNFHSIQMTTHTLQEIMIECASNSFSLLYNPVVGFINIAINRSVTFNVLKTLNER